MRIQFAAVCVIAVAAAAYAAAMPDLPFNNIINLDLPPEERWTQAISDLLDKQGWEYSFKRPIDFIDNSSPYTKQALDMLDSVLISIGQDLGEYGRELIGIHKVINSRYPGKLSLGRLVLLNIFYDVTAGCTSVVASSTDPNYCYHSASHKHSLIPPEAPQVFEPTMTSTGPCADANGALIHGRNLDFPIPGLPNITSVVHFTRNGKVVTRGVTYLGYVGLLTGYKPSGWSVTVDQRDKHNWVTNDTLPIIENVISALKGGQSLGIFLRKSLQDLPTYREAMQALNSTRLVAPVYLIVGGLRGDEGAVITRNREGPDFSSSVRDGIWTIDNRNGNWFRAQTNEDHWNPARDNRRDTINKAVTMIGRNRMNQQTMWEAMNTNLILNQWTTFITYMSPIFDSFYVEVTHRNSTSVNHKMFAGMRKIE